MIKFKAGVPLFKKRDKMLKISNFIFIFLLVAISLNTEVYANLGLTAQQQQKKQISGTVIDESGITNLAGTQS